MKEQIQKHARKHIKSGYYPKVTLGHRGLINKNSVKLEYLRACSALIGS
jgi:hypothetical protein